MEEIFELLIRVILEFFGQIIGEIILGIPEIIDGIAQKLNLPIVLSSSVEIIELNLFD